ncbi:MAG: hypothetical protein WCR42_16445, partial [bacterium]
MKTYLTETGNQIKAKSVLIFIVTLVFILLFETGKAIPAFSRKYSTSCITCHSVYPKLNPFGEAFRINGYKY